MQVYPRFQYKYVTDKGILTILKTLHWVEFTRDRWIPGIKASDAANVSIDDVIMKLKKPTTGVYWFSNPAIDRTRINVWRPLLTPW